MNFFKKIGQMVKSFFGFGSNTEGHAAESQVSDDAPNAQQASEGNWLGNLFGKSGPGGLLGGLFSPGELIKNLEMFPRILNDIRPEFEAEQKFWHELTSNLQNTSIANPFDRALYSSIPEGEGPQKALNEGSEMIKNGTFDDAMRRRKIRLYTDFGDGTVLKSMHGMETKVSGLVDKLKHGGTVTDVFNEAYKESNKPEATIEQAAAALQQKLQMAYVNDHQVDDAERAVILSDLKAMGAMIKYMPAEKNQHGVEDTYEVFAKGEVASYKESGELLSAPIRFFTSRMR